MTSIPDLIDNWRKRRLDGDVSFGVLVDETIDLLARLITPGDEGLETTEDDLIALEELERDEYLKGVDIANIGKLLRDFDLLCAKLRAAEARSDSYEAALRAISCLDDKAANERLAKTGSYGSFDEPGSVQIARAALNPETSP